MALRTILQERDERLYKKSRKVEKITPRTLQLLDDMKETLKIANGYGLAAPQVGVLRRVVVINMGDGIDYELINPEIIAKDGSQTGEEGCLSCGLRRGIVTRANKVVFQALNREGVLMEYKVEGLFARCIQHEIDHLEGMLFVDKMEKELFDDEEDLEEYDDEMEDILEESEEEEAE